MHFVCCKCNKNLNTLKDDYLTTFEKMQVLVKHSYHS